MLKVFMVVVCLAVIGAGVFMGFFADDFYSGKETFHTEQEYTLFKEAMSSPNVRINTMRSLSSEPPIIVDFVIRAPNDEVFPYGKKDNSLQPGGCILAGLGFVALCFVLFYNPKQEGVK